MPYAAPLRFFSAATSSSLSHPPNQRTRWDFGETAARRSFCFRQIITRISAIGTKRTSQTVGASFAFGVKRTSVRDAECPLMTQSGHWPLYEYTRQLIPSPVFGIGNNNSKLGVANGVCCPAPASALEHWLQLSGERLMIFQALRRSAARCWRAQSSSRVNLVEVCPLQVC